MSGHQNGRPARVVLIGAGEVAESYWLPGVAVLGWQAQVLDLDTERALAVAGRAGPRVTAGGTLTEVAPREHDVVVVATPPGSHGAVVREAVAAGARRLVVEKPPFISTDDMDDTMSVLAEQPTNVDVAFHRRRWRPIVTAGRLFPTWRERYGDLVAARITEGRPYAWKARGVAEQGIAGLADMFLDEIPHSLDALFRIAGWSAPTAVEVRSADVDLLGVDVEARCDMEAGPVNLRILGSRKELMPNTIDFAFERASVTVEMQPNGGVVVRPAGGEPTLLRCDGMPIGVEEMFAHLLQRTATEPLTETPVALEAWRGPLAVIEAVAQR